MLHILALLKFELIQKKVLIFVNSIDMAFRLRLFLEKVNHTNALSHYSLP
jgi:ATP-dependent RNA helicase DDX56/DBP9